MSEQTEQEPGQEPGREPDQEPGQERGRAPVAGRALLIAVGLVIAFGAGIVGREIVTGGAPDTNIQGLFWPEPKSVEAFELTDHTGAPFDRSRLDGKWSLLFFGYTHCPDICPVTLSALKQTQALLAEQGAPIDDLQTVFVSVDPERDSLEHLGEYVRYFDPRFLGVTGSDEALKGLTRQLGVLYIFNEPDENGAYLVDHTAAVLMVDPQHRLIGLLGAPHDPVDMADRITRIRAVVEG